MKSYQFVCTTQCPSDSLDGVENGVAFLSGLDPNLLQGQVLVLALHLGTCRHLRLDFLHVGLVAQIHFVFQRS